MQLGLGILNAAIAPGASNPNRTVAITKHYYGLPMSDRNRRKVVYERVKSYIMQNTINSHTNQKAVKEQQLKLSLCAHGNLETDEVNTALKALGEQEVIQYGSGWITPVIDEEYHREAIEYVVENQTGDVSEFVGVANTALQKHDW